MAIDDIEVNFNIFYNIRNRNRNCFIAKSVYVGVLVHKVKGSTTNTIRIKASTASQKQEHKYKIIQ